MGGENSFSSIYKSLKSKNPKHSKKQGEILFQETTSEILNTTDNLTHPLEEVCGLCENDESNCGCQNTQFALLIENLCPFCDRDINCKCLCDFELIITPTNSQEANQLKSESPRLDGTLHISNTKPEAASRKRRSSNNEDDEEPGCSKRVRWNCETANDIKQCHPHPHLHENIEFISSNNFSTSDPIVTGESIMRSIILGKIDPTFQCRICGQVYKSIEQFRKHQGIRPEKLTGFKPQCTICDQSFKRNKQLVSHMWKVHGERVKDLCKTGKISVKVMV